MGKHRATRVAASHSEFRKLTLLSAVATISSALFVAGSAELSSQKLGVTTLGVEAQELGQATVRDEFCPGRMWMNGHLPSCRWDTAQSPVEENSWQILSGWSSKGWAPLPHQNPYLNSLQPCPHDHVGQINRPVYRTLSRGATGVRLHSRQLACFHLKRMRNACAAQ